MTGGRPFGDVRGRTFKVRVPAVPLPPEEWLLPGTEIPEHHAYVTINPRSGPPTEVFVTTRRAGIMQGTVNALCRLVSLALRNGIPLQQVIGALRGQADGLHPVWWPGGPPKGGSVLSVADAVAKLLERRIKEEP